MDQIEYFGYDSIEKLRDILTNLKIKNIFLVTGKSSYESSGAKEKIEIILNELKIKFFRFFNFSSNPKLEEISMGFNEFKKDDYELIIGVGGGSVIDVAKSIKLFNYKETHKKIHLIAIPTTAGTGSEATYFVVYYIGKEKQSQGESDITLPNYSIIDPEFVLNLPRKISADTGLDALAQAIESCWSIYSTEESKKYAKEAITLLIDNLESSINNPNKKNKENVMLAANLAGKAINISKTTACHSIAYPLTSYFNIAHGHAAALTLGEVLVFNSELSESECNDKRGANYVKDNIKEIVNLLKCNNVNKARDKVKEIIKSIGLKTELSGLGLSNEDIKTILEKGFTIDRVKNNPRNITKESLDIILHNIF